MTRGKEEEEESYSNHTSALLELKMGCLEFGKGEGREGRRRRRRGRS